MKFLLLTASMIVLIFLVIWGYNILTKKVPVGVVKGVVIEKSDEAIKVRETEGSEIQLPLTDFNVGEQVNIAIYKNKLFNQTEYRYFKSSFINSRGE